MSRIIALALVFFAFKAFAHVEPGSYMGWDQNGYFCLFTVGEVSFENDMHHPLMERLPVTSIMFNGENLEISSWSLGHPPVVDIESGTNRYNHDIFQQIVATKVGAASVTLLKASERKILKEEAKKPVGIIYMEDNYRNSASSKKMTCLL